ncbi:hypothetical protein P3T35_001591 [Kitasatospora sp. GP30]|uniref:hypothetical protein n=1 Tax=Kitasatospora sp. GP30 TaxID=3035084 RepID=UPI000C6FE888|nr:hypothetical protein [Kitasatospora sp. GP30]MDH6139591.1 hypothetical protein [Kitasatospora sp. GP30]
MSDETASIVDAVFGRLPMPETSPGCGVCLEFQKRHEIAIGQGDGTAEVDARVLWRNHLAHVHGITYQGISYS